ncbi:hypothetical protein TNCV_4486871 [Trichonephila clavipes]|nr:hypothetical protein TNCV_4486871 [Trichonephila clavipes]
MRKLISCPGLQLMRRRALLGLLHSVNYPPIRRLNCLEELLLVILGTSGENKEVHPGLHTLEIPHYHLLVSELPYRSSNLLSGSLDIPAEPFALL